MAALVDEIAVSHLANFVHAIGELIAPVLNVHGRVRIWGIDPVDINNPCHGMPLLRQLPRRSNPGMLPESAC
jgi:hypothetical protein